MSQKLTNDSQIIHIKKPTNYDLKIIIPQKIENIVLHIEDTFKILIKYHPGLGGCGGPMSP